MKCTVPEISWHNKEPVLSVDIFSEKDKDYYKLASGGADCHVLIWHLTIRETGAVDQELITDLTYHQKAVNCVRWFQTQYLASADDDGNIIIWNQKPESETQGTSSNALNKESWIICKTLRGHKEDIYDLCWSIDGSKLLSGSVDNTAILWDFKKGQIDKILNMHKGFVQGVAWDPKNQFLATISTDKSCRLFDINGKQVVAKIRKGKLTKIDQSHELYNEEVTFFHNDTFKSFFRRLQFTPDGSLLIIPSGRIEAENNKTPINSTLIFTLNDFKAPAAILPLGRQSSTVVRCCPILFELRKGERKPYFNLPYRIIFAVGTDHDIFLYDTQMQIPFARFQNLHYTRLTDITWSNDGKLLMASSTDGFCTFITLETTDLGVQWIEKEPVPDANFPKECDDKITQNLKTNDCILVNNETNKKLPEKIKKKSNFLVQWSKSTPTKKRKLASENTHITSSEIIQSKEDNLVKTVETIQKSEPTNLVDHHHQKDDKKKLVPKRSEEASMAIREFFDKMPKQQKKEIQSENVSKSKQAVNILIPRKKPRVVDNISGNVNFNAEKKLLDNNTKCLDKTVKRITPIKVSEKSETTKGRHESLICTSVSENKTGNITMESIENNQRNKSKNTDGSSSNISNEKETKMIQHKVPTISHIDLALDVTNDDTWNCDHGTSASKPMGITKNVGRHEITEEIEDFSLHLDDAEIMLNNENIVENKKTENIVQPKTTVITAPSRSAETLPPLNQATKPPRRVALITLSGPKSKK